MIIYSVLEKPIDVLGLDMFADKPLLDENESLRGFLPERDKGTDLGGEKLLIIHIMLNIILSQLMLAKQI